MNKDLTESKKHSQLVQEVSNYLKSVGKDVAVYYPFQDKKIDIITFDNQWKIDSFGECIVSQSLIDAFRKLKELPDLKKTIYRYEVKPNPLSKKRVKWIKENGINIVEMVEW